MLDKEQFKNTEARLYRYYKNIKEVENLKYRAVVMYKQIEQIKKEKESLRPEIEYIQSSPGINEKVQTSCTGESYAERAYIKSLEEYEANLEKLDNEIRCRKRKILKFSFKIREMEDQIAALHNNISMLSEENKRFLEYKYGEKLNPTEIAEKMNMATATAYRKREELVEDIAQWCNVIN